MSFVESKNATSVPRELAAVPLQPVMPDHGYFVVCQRRAEKLREKQGLTAEARGAIGTGPRVRIGLRPYQLPIFQDRSTGILALHWSRQIGKSFVLAAWAVDRLLTRPGRLVTVLSNSRDNGAEFVAKCAEVCRLNGTEYKSVDKSRGGAIPKHADGGADPGGGQDGTNQGAGGKSTDGAGIFRGLDPGRVRVS